MKEQKDYYLLSIGENGERYETPQIIGLHGRYLSTKESVINWMKIGCDVSDYIYAKRTSATSFKCPNTGEIFTRETHGSYTKEAWENFIRTWKYS